MPRTKNDLSKGEASSERILEAAFQLFVKQGFHGTSMRQIAKEASFTPASIYNHFADKDEIFHQVILRYHPYREIIPALQAAQGETVEELVQDAARRVFKVISARRELLNLFFSEIVEFEGAHIKEIFKLVFPQVQVFLERVTKADGSLRPFPQTSILFSLMGLVMSQWMMEAAFFKNAEVPVSPTQFQDSIEIYLHGILAGA
jgi:AcrR family transcriptional regulator